MLQVIPKWKITVTIGAATETSTPRVVELWMYDHQIENVLRNVSSLQFSESGLIKPTAVQITLA